MKHLAVLSLCRGAVCFSVLLIFLTGVKAQTSAQLVPATLNCGAYSRKSPDSSAYSVPLAFKFENSILTAKRVLTGRPGRETLRGKIAPTGKIQVTARGRYDGRGGHSWITQFSGDIREGHETVLQGTLRDTYGGTRRCSIVFIQIPKPTPTTSR